MKFSIKLWIVIISLIILFFMFLGYKELSSPHIETRYIEEFSPSSDMLSKNLPNSSIKLTQDSFYVLIYDNNSMFYEAEKTYVGATGIVGFFIFEAEVDINNLKITKDDSEELYYNKGTNLGDYHVSDPNTWTLSKIDDYYVAQYMVFGNGPEKPTRIKLSYTSVNKEGYIKDYWPYKIFSFFKIRAGGSSYTKIQITVPPDYSISDYSPAKFKLSKDKRTLTYLEDYTLDFQDGPFIKIAPQIKYRRNILLYYTRKYLLESLLVTVLVILSSLFGIGYTIYNLVKKRNKGNKKIYSQ